MMIGISDFDASMSGNIYAKMPMQRSGLMSIYFSPIILR